LAMQDPSRFDVSGQSPSVKCVEKIARRGEGRDVGGGVASVPRELSKRRFSASIGNRRAPHSPALQKVTPRPLWERGRGLRG
jgi:hypothetical protein